MGATHSVPAAYLFLLIMHAAARMDINILNTQTTAALQSTIAPLEMAAAVKTAFMMALALHTVHAIPDIVCRTRRVCQSTTANQTTVAAA